MNKVQCIMVACCMALVTVVIGQTRDEYYYADGQRIYWVEDSTSANIIVANMEHYDAIVSQLEHIFSDEMDEIWYDDEDDNVKAIETDLFVRDTLTDDGATPSNTTYMWCSPDIWLEDMNGNVVCNPIGGCNYNVCVKVHNRRNIASTGTDTLILNWVKAGIGTGWFAAWSGESYFNCNGQNVPKGGFITPSEGVVIPSIPAFGERVVKVLWRTPDPVEYEHCSDFGSDLWHFCLLARIHDKNEIMGENTEGYGMADFVTRNNNVAWKNIDCAMKNTY